MTKTFQNFAPKSEGFISKINGFTPGYLARPKILRFRPRKMVSPQIWSKMKPSSQRNLKFGGSRGLRGKNGQGILELCHKIRRFHFQNRRFHPRIFGPSLNITVSTEKNGLTPDLVKNETAKLEKSEFWGLKGTQRKNGLGNFRALPQNPKVSFPK